MKNNIPAPGCVCPANVPVCPKCGRKWEHFQDWGNVRSYTSSLVVNKYRAQYGEPSHPFVKI